MYQRSREIEIDRGGPRDPAPFGTRGAAPPASPTRALPSALEPDVPSASAKSPGGPSAMRSRPGSFGSLNGDGKPDAHGVSGPHHQPVGSPGGGGGFPHPQPHPPRHSNVYVKNLAEDVDEIALKAAFERFGAVESCCVIRDVSTNNSRGFGFVKFAEVAQAASAIANMHGKLVRGRALEVKFANADSSATGAGANGLGVVSDNIYVKGLPPHWTEHELRAYFKMFGAIIECRLLHASGTTTAGALIRFGSMEQAAGAVLTANGRVPAGGVVPLVIRFADSHGKSRRASKNEKAANGEGSVKGGSALNGGLNGGGLNGANHRFAGAGVATPGSSAHGGSNLGSRPGSFDASGASANALMANAALAALAQNGSAHNLELAGILLAQQNAGLLARARSAQMAHEAAAEASARPRSIEFGAGSFASPARGGGVNVSGWADPGDDHLDLGGAAGAMHPAHVGGLSAMFAAGLGVQQTGVQQTGGVGSVHPALNAVGAQPPAPSAVSSLSRRSNASAGSLSSRGSSVRGGNAFGPGSALAAGAQGGFIESGGLGAGSSLGGSHGGGLMFEGSPSTLGSTRAGAAGSLPSAAHNPAPRSSPGSFGHLREPHATTAVSPVGSFDGGGLWAMMPPPKAASSNAPAGDAGGGGVMMSGDERGYAAQNANANMFRATEAAAERAETPGISPEEAREVLARLEEEEEDHDRGVETDADAAAAAAAAAASRGAAARASGDEGGGAAGDYSVVIRGLPPIGSSTGDPGAGEEEAARGAKAAATELALYRRCSPLGAVLSVTLGPGEGEARVAFARRADAASAEKALREAPIEGRAVEAEVVCEGEKAKGVF